MATFQSDQVRDGKVFSGICPPNQVQTVCGIYNIATALAQNDIVQLVRLPAGATVVGGHLRAVDLDTGTEALDIDIGWAANGVELADPDGFGNLGVWTGDTNNTFQLANVLFTTGPQFFTNETIIQLVCNAVANAGGTGKVWLVVEYVMGV